MPFREMRQDDFITVDGPATISVHSFIGRGKVRLCLDAAETVKISQVQLPRHPTGPKRTLQQRRSRV